AGADGAAGGKLTSACPRHGVVEDVADEDGGSRVTAGIFVRLGRQGELVRTRPHGRLRANLRDRNRLPVEEHAVAGDVGRLPDTIPDHADGAALEGVQFGVNFEV